MRKALLAICLTGCGICILEFGILNSESLAAADERLVPTESETLQLQVAQRDAIIASQRVQLLRLQLDKALADEQQAIQKLRDKGDSVKRAHHWDADAQFDLGTLQFSLAPNASAPKSEPAKPTPPAGQPSGPAPR